jgi:hypothetical protein
VKVSFLKFLFLRCFLVYVSVVSASQLESVDWGADRCGVTPARFYDLARENFFPPGVVVRFGRQIKVNPDRLEEFIAGGGAALPGGWRKEATS